MNGIEMMLSRMIGMTPEELRAVAVKITSGVETLQSDIATIKKEVAEIKAHLGLENFSDATGNGNGKPSLGNSGNSAGGRTERVEL